MKKIFKTLVMPIILFCCCLLCFNDVIADQDKGYYYTVTDDKATITAWSSRPIGTVVIPSTLGEYQVTKIGHGAFMDCQEITKVIIPEGVTFVDKMAFSGCTELLSVSLPNSLTQIEEQAFRNCDKLDGVAVPGNVSSWGANVFSSCDNLEDISLSNNMTDIPIAFLSDCKSLTTIVLPNNLNTISSEAFAGSGIRYINIPNGVTEIKDHAFYRCSALESVTIPDSVETIGLGAFSECDNLTDVYYNSGDMEWRAIDIKEENEPLTAATFHYNYENSEFDGIIYNTAYNEGRITATIEKKKSVVNNAFIYFALYNGDSLVHIKRIATLSETTILNEDISAYSDAVSAKILFLYDNLRLLCKPGIIDLETNVD